MIIVPSYEDSPPKLLSLKQNKICQKAINNYAKYSQVQTIFLDHKN